MMKNHSLDAPPVEAAAAYNINDGASCKVGAPSLLAADDDPYSTLITPTKAVADQQHQQLLLLQQKKEKQLQQPQQNVGKNVSHEPSTHAPSLATTKVTEKKHKNTATTTSEGSTTAAKSASNIKWPPVSSTKSLPPLSGRVSNLLIAEDSLHAPSSSKLSTSVHDTIEFEVNQECEC